MIPTPSDYALLRWWDVRGSHGFHPHMPWRGVMLLNGIPSAPDADLMRHHLAALRLNKAAKTGAITHDEYVVRCAEMTNGGDDASNNQERPD